MKNSWTKSSYSTGGGGNCVECRSVGATAQVRDSKNPSGDRLEFPAKVWWSFLGALKEREL